MFLIDLTVGKLMLDWTKIELQEVDVPHLISVTGVRLIRVQTAFDPDFVHSYDSYRPPAELKDRLLERERWTDILNKCQSWEEAYFSLKRFDDADLNEKDLGVLCLCVKRLASFFLKPTFDPAA